MTPDRARKGKRVAIIAGCRTPFARAGGFLAGESSLNLARTVVAELLHRAELPPARSIAWFWGRSCRTSKRRTWPAKRPSPPAFLERPMATRCPGPAPPRTRQSRAPPRPSPPGRRRRSSPAVRNRSRASRFSPRRSSRAPSSPRPRPEAGRSGSPPSMASR